MRVWDLPVENLCDKHLLGQHNEIHAIYSIITNEKKAYANHPEVKRWRDSLNYLGLVHLDTSREMIRRGMKERSPITTDLKAEMEAPDLWQPIKKQIELLESKGCKCKV